MSYFFTALFGLAIGSFFSVVIIRTATGKSLSGRSICVSAAHKLRVWQLIPLFSYLFQKGRCTLCSARIPPLYVLVELSMVITVIFLWHAHRAIDLMFLYDLILFSTFILLFWQDARYGLLQDAITLPAIGTLFSLGIILGRDPVVMILSALVGAAFFWIQRLVSKGAWVGSGDIRLGALMGVVLSLPQLLGALGLGYIGGALIATALLLSKRAHRGTALPLGVFLIPAAAFVYIYGDTLWQAYRSLLF